MFKVRSLILTAALFGQASVANADGCYSTYIKGGSYSAGEMVSATKITESSTTASCTIGDVGCPASGYKTTPVTMSETNNYTCKDGVVSLYCSQAAYAPNGMYSGEAWTKQVAMCTGSATPASAIFPAAWAGGRCPKSYSGGDIYKAGDVVSVIKESSGSLSDQVEGSITIVTYGKFILKAHYSFSGLQANVNISMDTPLGNFDVGTIVLTFGYPFARIVGSSFGCEAEATISLDFSTSTVMLCGRFAYSAGEFVRCHDIKFGISNAMVYQCAAEPTNRFCGQTGYVPGTDQYWERAWTALGSCVVTTDPALAHIPAAWAGGGCPNSFSGSDFYEAGDVVSVIMGTSESPRSEVTIISDPKSGVSLIASYSFSGITVKFKLMTSDDTIDIGSIELDESNPSAMLGGFFSGVTVEAVGSFEFARPNILMLCGTIASLSFDHSKCITISEPNPTMVYECAAEPTNLFCGQTGYAPGVDQYWEQAWTALGSCIGTIAPTTSPVYDSLPYEDGCSGAYDSGVLYEEGDKVSKHGLVYQCKGWPYSLHCSQMGYEPNTNLATPDAWKDAWAIVSYCLGTVGPTASPVFDPAKKITGGCPAEWSASTTDYEDGDLVSYVVSRSPERKVMYECRAWPHTGFCNQGVGYEPTTKFSYMAWTFKGSCMGGGRTDPKNPADVFATKFFATQFRDSFRDSVTAMPTCTLDGCATSNNVCKIECALTDVACSMVSSQADYEIECAEAYSVCLKGCAADPVTQDYANDWANKFFASHELSGIVDMLATSIDNASSDTCALGDCLVKVEPCVLACVSIDLACATSCVMAFWLNPECAIACTLASKACEIACGN